MIAWLRRFFDRLRGTLPAPDPRCIVHNWRQETWRSRL
jgi:hypothetical protein